MKEKEVHRPWTPLDLRPVTLSIIEATAFDDSNEFICPPP
jgi:hypothetical protein